MNLVKDLRQSGLRSHHPNLSPSSLPAILQCACFTGRGESDDDANKGNDLHDCTQDIVAQKIKEYPHLTKEEIECCAWAAVETVFVFDEIATGEEVKIEELLSIRNGKNVVISSGYADFNGGCVVVDLKSGLDFRPDLHYHEPQLHAYALAKMQELKIDRVYCLELYIMPKKRRGYWVTLAQCEATIAAAVTRRNNPEKKPLVNDFCKWCGRIVWCTAINKLAWRTVELYAKANGCENLFANPDQISCPEVMAQALTLAKKVLTPLQKRIEDAALRFSEKKEIPYYVRSNSSPREKIVDVRAAFNQLPFDNAEFSSCLSTTPKTIAEVYAEKFGVPGSQARSIVDGLLENLIVRGESNPTLKPLLQNQTKKRRGK